MEKFIITIDGITKTITMAEIEKQAILHVKDKPLIPTATKSLMYETYIAAIINLLKN